MNKLISGAQAAVEILQRQKVEAIFGYTGAVILPFYKALRDSAENFTYILSRHEQGAVFAAQGFARSSGKVGVCVSSDGPSATNLITGIADAYFDKVPIICIAGQLKIAKIGTHAFQDINLIEITKTITKWNYQIRKAYEVPEVFMRAFMLAQSGNPGPVLIDFTVDAQIELFDFEKYYREAVKLVFSLENKKERKIIPNSEIEEVLSIIENSKRPYVLVGHGVEISGAKQEVIKLAEKLDAPLACSMLGLSGIPANHPLYAGMLGVYGNYAANILADEADLIIAIGTRFNDKLTGDCPKYADTSKLILINVEHIVLQNKVHDVWNLQGDAKDIVEHILAKIARKNNQSWIAEFKRLAQIEYKKIIEPDLFPTTGPIKMPEVIKLLSDKTKGDLVLIADVGWHQIVTCKYYKFSEQSIFFTSAGFGAMGFALPAAIGAKVAVGQRTVVAVVGDGSFQLSMQELGVLLQAGIKVKILLLSNMHLGMVQQQLYETPKITKINFTNLVNPDFLKIAESYKIFARRVIERGDLSAALDELLQAERSFLLEVVCEEHENFVPIIPSGGGFPDTIL